MVDKKINFTLFVFVVNQIITYTNNWSCTFFKLLLILFTNFSKHSVFFFLFLVLQSFEEFSQCIPLSDVLTLISNWDKPLVPTLNHYNHFKKKIKNYRVIFVQTISRKYLKPKSLSKYKTTKYSIAVGNLLIYHSSDILVKVLKVQ